MVVSVAYVGAAVGASELLRARRGYGDEFSRKVVHVSVGLWIIPTLFLYTKWYWAALLPACAVAGNALSMRFNLMRGIERGVRHDYGTILFPLSFVIVLALFFGGRHPEAAAVGIMIMGLGDAAAAIVGKAAGRHPYVLLGAKKSIEGSAAMLVVSAAAAFGTLLIFRDPGGHGGRDGGRLRGRRDGAGGGGAVRPRQPDGARRLVGDSLRDARGAWRRGVRIFLTGGTGYIGRRLVTALISAGHSVTVLARSRERAAPLAALGAAVVDGDVAEFQHVEADWRSFDACIHSAAVVKVRGSGPDEFDRVNVTGVARVAETFLDAGVARFIYTSSFMALGPSGEQGPLDESACNDIKTVHNDYERTKYLGLVEFERWVNRGLHGISLIPCIVYGPGAVTGGNLVSGIIADILRGRFPGVLGDGQTSWTYSFVEDVVAGHVAALERGTPGARYILGGESVTMERFVEMAAELAGVRAPTRHIPFWVAKAGALFEETLATLKRREPKVSRQVAEIYRHSWTYRSDKAIRELGYEITPLADGLGRTVEWVKSEIAQGRMQARPAGIRKERR